MGIENLVKTPANCFGYGYEKLELPGARKYIYDIDVNLAEYFEPATNFKDLRAVAIIPKGGDLSSRPEHLAVFDTEDKRYIWHIPMKGEEPVRDRFEVLLIQYKNCPEFQFVFLKLKEKIPVPA